MKAIIFTLTGLLLFASLCTAQDGKLDYAFGVNGVAKADSMNIAEPFIYTALQPDGKIIAATTYKNYQGSRVVSVGFIVKRFLPNGMADSSFNPNCRYQVSTSSRFSGTLYGMVIQSSGKIVVTGNQTTIRFMPDGNRDLSFGDSAGIVQHKNYIITSLALLADDKMIFGGTSVFGDFAITIKLTAVGQIDSSYGVNGFTSNRITASIFSGFFPAVAISNDNKIIVGGSLGNSPPTNILIRYNPDGTKDQSFGAAGIVRFEVNGILGSITGAGGVTNIRVQPDGKICVAGLGQTIAAYPNSYASYLARFSTDGTIDSDFHQTGIFLVDSIELPSLNYTSVLQSCVNIQKDGRLLHAFTSQDSNRLSLRRFEPNGSTDSSFGTDGLASLVLNDCIAPGSILVQLDNKIIVAAFGGYTPTMERLYLVRYLSSLHLGVLIFQNSIHTRDVYPNPISQSATITYELSSDEVISISLVDMTGKTVQHFITAQKRGKGRHSDRLFFNPSLPAAPYIISISNGTGQQSVRVTRQ